MFSSLVMSVAIVSCSSTDTLLVKTRDGMVRGTMEEGVMAFKGIPYARIERFRAPLPVEPWDTVMICDHYGPQVMQNTGRELPDSLMSEKGSAVLNVWTKDVKGKMPVMLWIHGGGFDSGSGSGNPGYGLAAQDVVSVSLNHRLNILGFLDLSRFSDKYADSANAGMLDIVAALQWIKDNISKFGGDPGNVTIFGESGGGGKVGTLMCMLVAKGLFHKAIIMSGTILNVNDKQMTEELGNAVLEELGITPDRVDEILDVTYRELYDAGQRAMVRSIGRRTPGTPMMWGFGPVPDGKTLLQQPFQDDLADMSADIPLMMGTTFNELQKTVYSQGAISFEEAEEQLNPVFAPYTGELTDAFKEAYPDMEAADLVSMDRMFRPKTLITADAIASSWKAPFYTYMFAWKSPVSNASVHGDELAFCFNTLDIVPRQIPSPTEQDRYLAALMSSAWVNFAKTGNPNVDGLPRWTEYKEDGSIMYFNYTCQLRHNPDRKIQDIMNKCCFKQLDKFKASK